MFGIGNGESWLDQKVLKRGKKEGNHGEQTNFYTFT